MLNGRRIECLERKGIPVSFMIFLKKERERKSERERTRARANEGSLEFTDFIFKQVLLKKITNNTKCPLLWGCITFSAESCLTRVFNICVYVFKCNLRRKKKTKKKRSDDERNI